MIDWEWKLHKELHLINKKLSCTISRLGSFFVKQPVAIFYFEKISRIALILRAYFPQSIHINLFIWGEFVDNYVDNV